MRKSHVFILYLLFLFSPVLSYAATADMDTSFSAGKTSAGTLNPSTNPTDPFVVPQYSDQNFNDAKAKGEGYQSDPSKISVDAETEMTTSDSGKFLTDSFANRPDPCVGSSSSVDKGNYNCNIKTTVWFDIVTQSCTVGLNVQYNFTADPSCISQATCNSAGVLNTTSDKCELASTSNCGSGYSYNSTYTTCTTTPTCPNGGSLSGGQCVLSATQNSSTSCSGWVCPVYAPCGPHDPIPQVNYYYCTFMTYCPWINEPWNIGYNVYPASQSCTTTYWYTCPSGFTLSGTSCYQTASCSSGGSYNSSINLCDAGVLYSCVSGYSLSGTVCQSSPICNSPTSYDTTLDQCANSSCLYVGGSYGNYVQNSSTTDNCTLYSSNPVDYTLTTSVCIDSACRNYTPPGVNVCPTCWTTQNTYFTDVQRESTVDSCVRQ